MSARLQNADARGNWERGKFTTMAIAWTGGTGEKVSEEMALKHCEEERNWIIGGAKRMANKGDGKYQACDGQIVKRTTGEPIPDDEPIFILRGRDRLAFHAISAYKNLAHDDRCSDYHMKGIAEALTAFAKFKAEHEDRMKQPGVTLGK